MYAYWGEYWDQVSLRILCFVFVVFHGFAFELICGDIGVPCPLVFM